MQLQILKKNKTAIFELILCLQQVGKLTQNVYRSEITL